MLDFLKNISKQEISQIEAHAKECRFNEKIYNYCKNNIRVNAYIYCFCYCCLNSKIHDLIYAVNEITMSLINIMTKLDSNLLDEFEYIVEQHLDYVAVSHDIPDHTALFLMKLGLINLMGSELYYKFMQPHIPVDGSKQIVEYLLKMCPDTRHKVNFPYREPKKAKYDLDRYYGLKIRIFSSGLLNKAVNELPADSLFFDMIVLGDVKFPSIESDRPEYIEAVCNSRKVCNVKSARKV